MVQNERSIRNWSGWTGCDGPGAEVLLCCSGGREVLWTGLIRSDMLHAMQNLALNIADKGFPISVYNRSSDKVDAAEERAKKSGANAAFSEINSDSYTASMARIAECHAKAGFCMLNRSDS